MTTPTIPSLSPHGAALYACACDVIASLDALRDAYIAQCRDHRTSGAERIRIERDVMWLNDVRAGLQLRKELLT